MVEQHFLPHIVETFWIPRGLKTVYTFTFFQEASQTGHILNNA